VRNSAILDFFAFFFLFVLVNLSYVVATSELGNAQLTGTIPVAIAGLTKLTRLYGWRFSEKTAMLTKPKTQKVSSLTTRICMARRRLKSVV
jgi:hypothetical protein